MTITTKYDVGQKGKVKPHGCRTWKPAVIHEIVVRASGDKTVVQYELLLVEVRKGTTNRHWFVASEGDERFIAD